MVEPASINDCIRDRLLMALMLCALVRSGEALAGDQATIAGATAYPEPNDLRGPLWSAAAPSPTDALLPRENFAAPSREETTYSATDFRPRKRSVFDADPTVGAPDSTPMLRGTTVWQRMSDYKSHDRVRVLTLWESSGGSVSLQAGKRGDPSLQWSSRVMNRGGATRGLLDRVFAASLARAGSSLRSSARPASVQAAPVTASMAAASVSK